MIEFKTFLQEMTVLFERFDRKHSKVIVERYYEFLNPRMTTEEFVAASKASFIADDFFPSPQRIFEKVKGSQEDLANREWDLCLESIQKGECRSPQGYYSFPQGILPATRKALQAIGGMNRLGNADTSEISFLRRDFIAAFSSYQPSLATALASSPDVPSLNGNGGLTHVGG